MKYSWIVVAGLMFVTNACFGDDTPKAAEKPAEAKAEATVESNTVSTVTVTVVGEDGKVIQETTESKNAGKGPQKIRVQIVDGKKVLELTTPDGKTKMINIGAAMASDITGKVLSLTLNADKEGNLAEVKDVQDQIAKVLKDLDVTVTVDAQKIAEQVKAAISQVQPGAGLAKQITGEVLMEIGESAFIVESDGSDEQAENESKVRRPLQIRRITASAAAMPEVMKKLEEITKRLEAIETRLDKIEQP